MSKKYYNLSYASMVQWLGFLLCDQKVMGSNPGRSKGVFSEQKILIDKLCVSAGTQKYGSQAQPSHVKIPV